MLPRSGQREMPRVQWVGKGPIHVTHVVQGAYVNLGQGCVEWLVIPTLPVGIESPQFPLADFRHATAPGIYVDAQNRYIAAPAFLQCSIAAHQGLTYRLFCRSIDLHFHNPGPLRLRHHHVGPSRIDGNYGNFGPGLQVQPAQNSMQQGLVKEFIGDYIRTHTAQCR